MSEVEGNLLFMDIAQTLGKAGSSTRPEGLGRNDGCQLD